jgi:hypothetical protein
MPAKAARMSWLAVANARLLFILFRSACCVASICFISAEHKWISLLAALTTSNTKLTIEMKIAAINIMNRMRDILMLLLTLLASPLYGKTNAYTYNPNSHKLYEFRKHLSIKFKLIYKPILHE